MKKHILISFVIISMIPSFAFAAWWNPLTWKIFKRAEVTTMQAPIFTPSSTEATVRSQAIEIEKLKKEVGSFKQKANPIAVVPKPPAVLKAEKKAPTQIIPEENFNGQLTELYQKKTAFLKKSIAIEEVSKTVSQISIRSAQEDINFFESNLSVYGSVSYSAGLIQLTRDAINFWKYKVAIVTTVKSIEEGRINLWGQIKRRLEAEIADISSQAFISETEYKLRAIQLDELVNEDNSNQNADVDALLAPLEGVDEKFHSLMLTMAQKEKAEADRELAAINAELEIIRSKPIPVIPVSITIDQLQPTRVSCETRHEVNGNPSTICTEFPSMKSMRCDTRYGIGGNAIKDCYFR